MHKTLKRTLAWLMVFVLCIGFFPVMDSRAYAAEPTTPVATTEPETPVEPETPTESTEPVEPTTPTEPTEPVEPSTPVEPTTPLEPIDPATPEAPAEPETPTEPIVPPHTNPEIELVPDVSALALPQTFASYTTQGSIEIAAFTWNGAEHVIKTDSADSGNGISWTADADGNFEMRFSADGTLTFTRGVFKEVNAHLIGGGAGGQKGWVDGRTVHGGAGGEGGKTVDGAVNIVLGEPITVKIGRGGGVEAPGTPSQFGTLIADGGRVGYGGAGGTDTWHGSGSKNGANGTGNDGGGGAVNAFFEETEQGCQNYNGWSCWNCGSGDGNIYVNFGAPYNYSSAQGGTPGAGASGGGRGGYPSTRSGCSAPNACSSCQSRGNGNGTAGQNGTGGGGGGGGVGTGPFGLGGPYAPAGSSRAWHSEPGSPGGAPGGDGAVSIKGKIEPKRELIINKTSSAPEMTDGNSCYSLEGAVYGVYTTPACTDDSLLFTLTTDVHGNTQSEPVELKTYYVKEISPSKGYLLDKKVYTLDMTTGNNVLNVKEVPGNDPIGISITKITDDPAATLPSLEGTQFTVKFYGGQYNDVSELPVDASRTWVIQTKAFAIGEKIIYKADLKNEYKVRGDEFFLDDRGNAIIPLGTITIQETSPADGYTTIGGYVSQGGHQISDAEGIILLNVTSSDSLSGGALNYGNEYTKTDKALYGGVKVQKYDAENRQPQGAGTLAGAEIKVITLNDKDITVNGQVYSNGQAVYTGTTDETGLFQTPSDLLPKGHYKVVETAPPAGYLLSGKLEQEFDIVEDGVLVDLTEIDNAIVDPPIRADFSLTKQDGDSKEPMANVLFSITSNTTGESHTFTTDDKGFYTSAGSDLHFGAPGNGGALLYDTYTIQELECEANKGYTLADPITITIDGSSVLVQVVGVYNYLMRMDTTARFQPSGNQWSMAKDNVKIRDTVSLENLVSGADYVLIGKLWNKTTGEFIKNSDGNEITCEKSFHTTSRATVQTMDFEPVNAEAFAGNDIVVYEYLYKDDKLMLSHTDENDPDQSLHFPKIGTVAKDGENGSSVSMNRKEITIVDTVSYTGLKPGAEYTVNGKLMDAATGQIAHDSAGKEIVSATTFTAANSNGSIDVVFTFNGNFETGKKFVAFEELYSEDVLMAVHADLSDEGQTVYIPKIGTEAVTSITNDHVGTAGEMTVTDTVSYSGLKTGTEYTVKGRVVKQTDKDVILAEAANTFTPNSESGEIKLEFAFDATELAGEAVVVFEEIYMGDALIASHIDVNDPAQTVYIPKIGTSAKDGENGSSVSLIKEEITIVDTISYSGLMPGESYTVKGKLMDKASGQPALDSDGKVITAETTFTAENTEGSIDVTFKFKGNFETAKKLVAFEELYYKDTEVAVHSDIDDDAQTVYIPKIRTTAITPHTGEHIGTAGEMTVIDTVTYEGLKPGLEYVMYGYIVDSSNPDTILGGAMTVFSAEAENGTADLELKVNAKDYAGKNIVVFEEILLDGAVVAVHKDTEDPDQSIIIPVIHTTARDSELGSNTAIADGEVTIIDTVTYENLIPNKEYTIEGKLVMQSAPEKVLAEKELTFTPEEPNGEVELEFTLDATELAGETIVAFETLKYNGATVAVHADINDKAQSIIFPEIKTKATVGGEKDAPARDRLTLIDEISYTNLTPGEVYTVCGVLVDKDTAEVQKDANGKKITAETTFTAESAAGTVWLTFEFNGENLKGKTLVAFDRLYLGTDTDAQPIAIHEDIDSAEQSIRFRADKPKTGDESNFALWTALLSIGIIGTAAVSLAVFRKNKKKDNK